MKNHHEQSRFLFGCGMLALLALPLAACPADDAEEQSPDSAEFTESLPDVEMLALTLDEEGTGNQALEVSRQALETDPAMIQERAQEVVDRVNEALQHTKVVLQDLFAGVEPVTPADLPSCRVWEADGEKAHWKLTICRKNLVLKNYGFKLQGRPLASTAEGDYLLCMAGAGRVLPRMEGKRRGAGVIGYDFDHLQTLRQMGPTGQMAFGYRAAGRMRALEVGLRSFTAEGDDQAISALYRFHHVWGTGGRLAFNLHADFVTRDGEGLLIRGEDGTAELGRAVLGWVRNGAARATAAVCGGTVGQDQCVYVRECWKAGERTFDLESQTIQGGWDEVVCPADRDLPLPVDQPPAEDELEVPADGSETPGPAVDEPAADPSLE